MNFCLVSAADFSGKFGTTHMDCMFDWGRVLHGDHQSIHVIKTDLSVLDEYDVILLVDSDRYLTDALRITERGAYKTVFCAEGTIHRFTDAPFNHFKIFHELLQTVDLIGVLEEDRIPWYNSLWDTPTFFMHVPTSDELLKGKMRINRAGKVDRILACCNLGFGPPHVKTNLVTSLGVIRKTGHPSLLCEIPGEQAKYAATMMGIQNISAMGRTPYGHYMRDIVAPSMILLNPSDMIGTSRNAIVGAGVGTPVIGNMHSHTQARLWPELGTYIYDTNAMVELVNRLYEDEVFYKDVCDRAFEAAKYYSRENTIKRFEAALEAIK